MIPVKPQEGFFKELDKMILKYVHKSQGLEYPGRFRRRQEGGVALQMPQWYYKTAVTTEGGLFRNRLTDGRDWEPERDLGMWQNLSVYRRGVADPWGQEA